MAIRKNPHYHTSFFRVWTCLHRRSYAAAL